MSNKQRVTRYDMAYMTVCHDVLDALVADDAILGDFHRVYSRHIGPRRNVRGEKPLDQHSTMGAATSTLNKIDILNTNIEAHDIMLYEMGRTLIKLQTKAFFSGVGEMSEAAGKSVPNIGKGTPTIEQLRELFQQMEFDFEEDGALSRRITLYVDPSMADKAKELMAAAESDPEITNIINGKRHRWFEERAKNRHRKLS